MSDSDPKSGAGPDESRKAKDQDTEGHRRLVVRDDEPGPEGARRKVLRDDDADVEGHRK